MTRIGSSDLDVLPLCLGGNVFGWTADRDTSFAILDAFRDGGGDFIDTADSYSSWVPGNSGGESESIIGEWLASRRPEGVVVATKVGGHPEFPGLSPANVRAAAEASARRLGVDALDVFYAHHDDDSVSTADIVAGFDALVRDGLVRNVGISNLSTARIREWLAIAKTTGAALPIVLQPEYSLVHRTETEADVLPLAAEAGLGVVPYYALASGFLAGKYRSTDTAGQSSPRARDAAAYATPAGLHLLDGLDEIAAGHDTSVAAVALAWLRTRAAVVAPIASASRVDQVAGLLDGARLTLTADEAAELTRRSGAMR